MDRAGRLVTAGVAAVTAGAAVRRRALRAAAPRWAVRA
ncbi:hypothetical protein M2169_003610 [Streptomyces sp. MJP52]|nr:hypothetical protein [Streptomyces sp. MJP52]